MASSAVRAAFLLVLLPMMAACMSQSGPPPAVQPAAAVSTPAFQQIGKASWYGAYHQGARTASGERFDMNGLTAAHRTLPLGTEARVTNLENGRSVVVVVNDRGPYRRDRIIDLSRRAAELLGFRESGIVRVKVEVLSKPAEVEAAVTAD